MIFKPTFLVDLWVAHCVLMCFLKVFALALTRIACYAIGMNTQEELIKLKERTGMNWKKFSKYFGIPYRTVQDWYLGNRTMPEYLLRLMIYKIEIEKIHK